jgi:NodT family efflux transporter outer membrane factor (OMF) lipoprotein
MRLRPIAIAALSATLLQACTAGPDFVRPAAPAADRYTSAPQIEKTIASEVPGGEAQHFSSGSKLDAKWWRAFGAPELDALVDEALKANPTVNAADAALRAALENVRAQQGMFWPSISADLNASRNKTAPVLSPALNSSVNPYSLHTAQLQISYPLDVFGGTRRQVESLRAQAEVQRFQLEAARVSLANNVVAAVVQLAALRDQLSALRDVGRLQAEQLEIVRKQFRLGEVAEANVIAQAGALAQTQAQLPALEKQLAQQNDALIALLGKLPGEQATSQFTLAVLHLPQELPMTLPSQLVEQRPDVRAAEAALHAANAQIGVAVAARLPQLTLSASTGSSATHFGDLLTAGTGFWGVAADLAQPIFQGGTLLHRQRAAEANAEQAAAQYRGAVVAAFQNVADTLLALQYDAEGLRASVEAERATRQTFEIARKQLELGDVSPLAVVIAEQAYKQALIARIQAQAARYADTAALFQALGGGWWSENTLAGQQQSDDAKR